MLEKTKGIVLNYFKYRESSIIVRIYTKEFGIQSYIENGVRTAKSKNKIAFFQPLTLLDLVVYHQKNKPEKLNRISELKCYFPYQHIPFEFKKQSIVFFLTEFLGKTLKEEVGDENLYQFLENAFILLDQQEENYTFFHIHFLLKFATYVGFEIENTGEIFRQIETYKTIVLTEERRIKTEENFNFMIINSFEQVTLPHKSLKNEMLNILLDFYQLHIENFGELKSLEVLREIMS